MNNRRQTPASQDLAPRKIGWACDLDRLPAGGLPSQAQRYYQLKNAFFIYATGIVAGLSPSPGFDHVNPGPSVADYNSVEFIFEYREYVQSLAWVQALPPRSLVCTLMFAVTPSRGSRATIVSFDILSSDD